MVGLSNTERQLILDMFDVYDLVEMLGLTAEELIDAFDFKVLDNVEIMEAIGVTEGNE